MGVGGDYLLSNNSIKILINMVNAIENKIFLKESDAYTFITIMTQDTHIIKK